MLNLKIIENPEPYEPDLDPGKIIFRRLGDAYVRTHEISFELTDSQVVSLAAALQSHKKDTVQTLKLDFPAGVLSYQ